MSTDAPSCASCRFALPTDQAADDGDALLLCRRHPPHPSGVTDVAVGGLVSMLVPVGNDAAAHLGQWPVVLSSQWCGEFAEGSSVVTGDESPLSWRGVVARRLRESSDDPTRQESA